MKSVLPIIRNQLIKHCGCHLPATSIVAQSPPAGESDVVLELICTRASD